MSHRAQSHEGYRFDLSEFKDMKEYYDGRKALVKKAQHFTVTY